MLLHHGNVEEKCENNKDVVRLSSGCRERQEIQVPLGVGFQFFQAILNGCEILRHNDSVHHWEMDFDRCTLKGHTKKFRSDALLFSALSKGILCFCETERFGRN